MVRKRQRLLYIRYNDGNTTQWVIACPQPDVNVFASINSPVFTGNPQAPTPATADSDTSIATTAFVHAVVWSFDSTDCGAAEAH